MGERKFIYTVTVTKDGKTSECGRIEVYQKILAKKIADTEVVKDNWEGLRNSYSTTETNLEIDKEKVKAEVGGDGSNINIAADANKKSK